jgi:hypothetical protein
MSSANPLQGSPVQFQVRTDDGGNGRRTERRRRARTTVHWPVLLFHDKHDEAIETLTEDLSSDGFFCMSRKVLLPGETLACAIRVPSYSPAADESGRLLECRVRVVRSGPGNSEGNFGIAFRIEDYRFVGSRR